jgi:hypothetical protein
MIISRYVPRILVQVRAVEPARKNYTGMYELLTCFTCGAHAHHRT